SHTSVGGHSREFLHGTNGTHFRAEQSLFAGQSAAVTHATHSAIDGSQSIPIVQSKLFRQPGGVPSSGALPPSDRVATLVTLPHAPPTAATAAITSSRDKERRPRSSTTAQLLRRPAKRSMLALRPASCPGP